jgi:hypothetical protein
MMSCWWRNISVSIYRSKTSIFRQILAPNADAKGQHPDPMTRQCLSGRQDWQQKKVTIFEVVTSVF